MYLRSQKAHGDANLPFHSASELKQLGEKLCVS